MQVRSLPTARFGQSMSANRQALGACLAARVRSHWLPNGDPLTSPDECSSWRSGLAKSGRTRIPPRIGRRLDSPAPCGYGARSPDNEVKVSGDTKGVALLRGVLWRGMVTARAFKPIRFVVVWLVHNYPQVLGSWPKRYVAYRSTREELPDDVQEPSVSFQPVSRTATGGSSPRVRRTVHQLVLGDFGDDARRRTVAGLTQAIRDLGYDGRTYLTERSQTKRDTQYPFWTELPADDDCVFIVHYKNGCSVPDEISSWPGAKVILLNYGQTPGVAHGQGHCQASRADIRDHQLQLLAANASAGISRNGLDALTLKRAGVPIVFDVGDDYGRLSHALLFTGLVPRSACADALKAQDGSLEFIGHANGSYSLARITRSLALGVERLRPGRVRLVPIEGSSRGSITGVPTDLLPEIRRLVDRPANLPRPIISILHHYPPITPPIQADVILALFPWEESIVPPELLHKIESAADAVLAPSAFVKKALIDSGIRRPVYTVLQAPDLSAFRHINTENNWPRQSGKFVFLHISSCFPRKGVDILLAAYAQAFTSDDQVELIVKGFPNPHNDVDQQLTELRYRHHGLAPVTFINEDTDDATLLNLYRRADALVLPTRGEGFNMPAAEGFAAGVPVITTAGGGHADFTDEETAWLIPYRFVYSKSHVASSGSVWLEPDLNQLATTMRRIFEQSRTPADRSLVTARLQRARKRVHERLSTEQWLTGVTRAADALIAQRPVRRRARLAWVSSWRAECGIAEYSQFLLRHFDKEDFEVGVFGDERTPVDDGNPPSVSFALPSWHREVGRWRHHCSNVARFAPDLIVLQHHWGLYGIRELATFLGDERIARAAIVLMLHNTQDLDLFDPAQKEQVFRAFRRADRILVHTLDDLNRLKDYGFADRATLFFHGVNAADAEPVVRPNGKEPPIIGSYGFFLPHKGLDVLIEALPMILERIPGTRLRLVNAEFPTAASAAELARCKQLAEQLGISQYVTFISDFLPLDESLHYLRGCDVLAFPYQESTESSSGAVSVGVAAGRPVATTPISIFEELGDARLVLPGTAPDNVARGLVAILSDSAAQTAVLQRQRVWMNERDWSRMATRLAGILAALLTDSRARWHCDGAND
jgi:glycosyltransferase involved in cell wall biosynthesis